MPEEFILCGSDGEADYTGVNSPTDRCPKHGDYLYFCTDCSEERKKA